MPRGDLLREAGRSGKTVCGGRPWELGAPGRHRGGQAPAPRGAGALVFPKRVDRHRNPGRPGCRRWCKWSERHHAAAPSPAARLCGHMPQGTASHAIRPAAAIPPGNRPSPQASRSLHEVAQLAPGERTMTFRYGARPCGVRVPPGSDTARPSAQLGARLSAWPRRRARRRPHRARRPRRCCPPGPRRATASRSPRRRAARPPVAACTSAGRRSGSARRSGAR